MLQFLHLVFVVSVSRAPGQLKPAYFVCVMKLSGRDSVVGIETDNGLDGPAVRIPVSGETFVQLSMNFCCPG
jgi:hypothetical protein